MNTIHLYEGWKPNYYTTIDAQVMLNYGEAVYARFRDIPKFISTPSHLDKWQGDNFYRFYHRPGQILSGNGIAMDADYLSLPGIAYSCVMHVAMQLAYFMGFTTLLMIGVQHRVGIADVHFWGIDHTMNTYAPSAWLDGYKELTTEFALRGVKVLNLSEDTEVPADVLPRGNWREWSKHHETINA